MCLKACCSWRGAETIILGSAHSTAYCIGGGWGRGLGRGRRGGTGDPWGLGGVGLGCFWKGMVPRAEFTFQPVHVHTTWTPASPWRRPGERLTGSVLPGDVEGMPSAESSPPVHLLRQASFRRGVESWAGLCQESGCRGEGRVWTSLPLWARGEASGPNTRLLGSRGLVNSVANKISRERDNHRWCEFTFSKNTFDHHFLRGKQKLNKLRGILNWFLKK